jgi:hypothetical protein
MDLAVWRPIRDAARKAGGQYRLTVPMDSESGFFRLMGGAGGPLAEDFPGDFADTNGDGIDGDFTRAVFLAPPPFGNDLNPGTALAPVATLEHAVELAESVPLRQSVYAAKGTYNLALPLLMPPRVSLFGLEEWVVKGALVDCAATSLATVLPEAMEAREGAEEFRAPVRVAPVDIPSPSCSRGNPKSPMISVRVTSIPSVNRASADREVRPRSWERHRRAVAGWSCPWPHDRSDGERSGRRQLERLK